MEPSFDADEINLLNNLTEKQLMFYVINSNTKVYINGELVFDKHRIETNKVSATGCYWVNLTLLRADNGKEVTVELQPLYAAIAGGLITGTGFLVLFRHRCSLGGVGIAALYLQDRYGWRAGKVQMAVDCCIVLLALWMVEPLRVAWSIAGAVALNLVLAMNHRPGRYMAV